MQLEDRAQRRSAAIAEFEQQGHRQDGQRIVTSLEAGLHTLRDLFYVRIQADVEKEYGMDSMLSPVSLVKSEMRTKVEVDIFQIAESAAEARARQFVPGNDD